MRIAAQSCKNCTSAGMKRTLEFAFETERGSVRLDFDAVRIRVGGYDISD